MTTSPALTASEREWLKVRQYLVRHRHGLGVRAASEYPGVLHVLGTPLLSTERWLPARPLPLDSVKLEFAPLASQAPTTCPPDLPVRADGSPYRSYSEAVAELAAPQVFENRATYRLLDADLAGTTPAMRFGRGTYFDSVDVGEASAHEYAGQQIGVAGKGFRAAIGDPCDSTRRPTNIAISTLTLRREPETGKASFVLHWRDPKKVGHAGGLYHVVPTGVFQPSGTAASDEESDFSLWHNMVREFAEELAGHSEDYGDGGINYAAWPFARRLSAARVYCLGIGVDPLDAGHRSTDRGDPGRSAVRRAAGRADRQR